jgi:hypothetical protein
MQFGTRLMRGLLSLSAVVEGITNGREERSPYEAFKTAFVQQLQSKIPSIAIAWGIPSRAGMKPMVDYVSRGLPLLILDSRPPPCGYEYDDDLAATEESLFKLERALIESGTINNYVSTQRCT